MNRAHITQHQARRAVAIQVMNAKPKPAPDDSRETVKEPVKPPSKPVSKIKSKDKRIFKKAIHD